MLENVPRIRDVSAMCQLLEGLGATVEGNGTSTLTVRCAEIHSTQPDPALVARIRGSVLLDGAAPGAGRPGRLGEPGGDFPARRSVTTHRRALAAFGARQRRRRSPDALAAPAGLRGASLYLDEASVTATETALLAAATAAGADRDQERRLRAPRRGARPLPARRWARRSRARARARCA